jgi:radical SAM protein with 4Fe4S-binding SPASM domain
MTMLRSLLRYLKVFSGPFYLRIVWFYLWQRRNKLPSLWRILVLLQCELARRDQESTIVAQPPYVVIIRLTNRCNLRCVQCGQWGAKGFLLNEDGDRMKLEELDSHAWKRCIDEVAVFRPYLAFFGGEPLLRNDIIELTKYASAKGLLVWMSTNATMLEGHAESIVRSGLDFLYFSIDGPEHVNNQIRIGHDTYSRSLLGVRAVIETKKRLRSVLPLLEWQMTLVKENQAHIWETSEIAWNLGVEYFSLRYPIFTTPELVEASNRIFEAEFGRPMKSCAGFISDMSQMEIELIAEQVKKVQEKWKYRYRPIPFGDDFDIARHFLNPGEAHGSGRCFIPWTRVQVMPNGDVVLCEDFPDLTVGNITAQQLLSIWNGPLYQKFRKMITTHGILPICARCCGLYEISLSSPTP